MYARDGTGTYCERVSIDGNNRSQLLRLANGSPERRREARRGRAWPSTLCVNTRRRSNPPKCDQSSRSWRNVEHDSLRFGQHEVATAPGPLYTLLVGHKKFSKLKYQATRASVGCTSRSVFFMIFSENQQIFF